MVEFTLAFKPTTKGFGAHDPSAAIFEDGELVYAIEEERLSRTKHAIDEFPHLAIRSCLDYCEIELSEVSEILLPYEPDLYRNLLKNRLRQIPATYLGASNSFSRVRSLYLVERTIETYVSARFDKLVPIVEQELRDQFGTPVPELETLEHHRCHAASAYYPAPFENGVIFTIDGRGEHDSTVVWNATNGDLERLRTYEFPNSLGHFYGAITEYLGYHSFNGEGKVMGLAPYGEENQAIRDTLLSVINMGVDYDVTELTQDGITAGVSRLEEMFDRPPKESGGEFTEWEKDLAFVAQDILEEIALDLIEHYCTEKDVKNVGLAGGVALNCKMNKRLMESTCVDNLFVQPVAHDGGLALGAGLLRSKCLTPMKTVYWGPEYATEEIRHELSNSKLESYRPDDLERTVAERIADGNLVGWFQGRMELGPRALGNRSILADPRTESSRDRVNEFVKHREEWRPFAPSIKEEAVDEYLENGCRAPFMIKTFDVKPEKVADMRAVVHPADDTTRPQTVTEEQNPHYYRLLDSFEDITGVPLVLNTSFNDHGEPIVNTPRQAIKDFFGMGLDTLVLNDVVVEKGGHAVATPASKQVEAPGEI